VLLMIVFRSIAVPLKATLGYLLSVGAALGAVVMVFEWGWADSLFPGISDGPVVSFLPIFVMGVLFGLAMDYEMFLVSAMREHFVTSDDAQESVREGFRASSRVVTAAALIMTSVFVAFIPDGTSTIKQIALGLSVGVFVDAFVVRMTLVPAVLSILDRHAWWLPHWLERRLPSVDVEGAALHRRIAFEDWSAEHGQVTLLARGLVAEEGDRPVEVVARPSSVTRLTATGDPVALGRVLTGHQRAFAGELVVDGLLLPEQREVVGERAGLVVVDPAGDDAADLVADRAALVPRRRRQHFVRRTHELVDELGLGSDGPAFRRAVVEVALAVASGADVVVLAGADLARPEQARLEQLAAALGRNGLTVVALDRVAVLHEDGLREAVLT
jgi:RND superfamily putative drug exporter